MSMRLTPIAAAALMVLTLVPPAAAQQRRPAEGPAASASSSATATQPADETRRELEELLRQYPPSLGRVLRLDSTLLGNQAYLQPYPALAAFLAQHPEVAHNVSYFLADFDNGSDRRNGLTPQDRAVDMWRNAIEGFTIGTVMLVIGAGILADPDADRAPPLVAALEDSDRSA